MSLQEELRMLRPFVAPEEEAVVGIIATKARVEEVLVQLLDEYGITRPQFNILRILRGAQPGSLTCSAINERLVEKSPDVTRLLDRLEAAGLIRRKRGEEDRRQVFSSITNAGMDLLGDLDTELLDTEKRMLGLLDRAEQRTLIDLLQKVRDRAREMMEKTDDTVDR